MKKLLVLAFALIFLLSCDNGSTNSTSKGTIVGKISLYSPIEDFPEISPDTIMVILVDADFEADTVQYDNKAAFLDTVYTDTTGTFIFENVEDGNYYVYPSSDYYYISSSDNSKDSIISISGDDYVELSYVAESISLSGIYQITVNLKNYDSDFLNFVNIERKEWICFVPTWAFASTVKTEYSNGVFSCTFGMDYGFSLGVYTLTNAYRLSFTDKIGNYFEDLVYEISTPINNTQSVVEFDIDAETGTVTRVK